ncbi:hypothetical protein GW935_04340 [Candidatus Falkowbacteria bacterium]|nr:hypothetical protein [Candidatus Falkowbacteria bacterium]
MNESTKALKWLITSYTIGRYANFEKKRQSDHYKTILWFVCNDINKANQSAKVMINKEVEFLAHSRYQSVEDFKKSDDFKKFSAKNIEAMEQAIANQVSDFYITSIVTRGLT